MIFENDMTGHDPLALARGHVNKEASARGSFLLPTINPNQSVSLLFLRCDTMLVGFGLCIVC